MNILLPSKEKAPRPVQKLLPKKRKEPELDFLCSLVREGGENKGGEGDEKKGEKKRGTSTIASLSFPTSNIKL